MGILCVTSSSVCWFDFKSERLWDLHDCRASLCFLRSSCLSAKHKWNNQSGITLNFTQFHPYIQSLFREANLVFSEIFNRRRFSKIKSLKFSINQG